MRIAAQTTDPAKESSFAVQTLNAFSDADLLDAWNRDRHRPALAELVQRYRVLVLSVCRRRCRSEADAEDAFQSTFLYLADNARKIRHPERLPGWLQRVAQRAAMATIKTASREREPMVEPPANPDDPLDRLTQRHEAIVLDEELADLPEHYRSAIVLHLYEGLSVQGLAEHFGTTVGSIRGRLQRGKQCLAQRLRHRGVVPVLAFAAADTWSATPANAAQLSEPLIEQITCGDLPEPPIQTPLLESLLFQGVRLMPSLYTLAGLAGGSALIACLVIANGSQGQSNDDTLLTYPPSVVGQDGGVTSDLSSSFLAQESGFEGSDGTGFGSSGGTETSAGQGEAGGGMFGDMGLASVGGSGGSMDDSEPTEDTLEWKQKPVLPKADSDLAILAANAMDKEIDMNLSVNLGELPAALTELLEVPVIMDSRGAEFAEQDLEATSVQFTAEAVPTRTALRRMLRPLGLKTVIENEGVVITADPETLVHRGIGTDSWINVEEEAERRIATALDSEASATFIELPLDEAAKTLSETHGIPIVIDGRAIEEIGLSEEEPVTVSMTDRKLRSLLEVMLRDLGLTYTVLGEALVITTLEQGEQELLNRIYWLEGTGYARGDDRSIIESIQTTIDPESWEPLGGPATMVPLGASRPALMIRATYRVHEDLESLFKTLRSTHFGQDPVLEPVQVPAGSEPENAESSGGFF
ncbi:MAG: RNA polymerase sigma factor [Rubripirellula sp.]